MTDISAFKNTRLLVIGDVMLDRYWWGSVTRISPEAPVPIVRLEQASSVPGGAANVAVNVSALGGMPVLIGCGGEDTELIQLKDSLRANGVRPDAVIPLNSRRTTVKTRILAHNQQVARIDQEDTSDIDTESAALVCAQISEHLPKTDLVIVSDYAKGTLSKPVLKHLFDACRTSGKTILVDPKGRDFAKYEGATILTPNCREAAEACSLIESEAGIVEIAGLQLMEKFDFESVLITEGENGMTLFEKDSVHHIDTAARQVFDVTGAGDTVIATLGVALAAGLELRSAVSLANTAAGISVGRVGTSPVTIEALCKELEREQLTKAS